MGYYFHIVLTYSVDIHFPGIVFAPNLVDFVNVPAFLPYICIVFTILDAKTCISERQVSINLGIEKTESFTFAIGGFTCPYVYRDLEIVGVAS